MRIDQVKINKPFQVGEKWYNPVWVPQPGPQSEFLASKANFLGFGGAFGGSKTATLVAYPSKYAHLPDYKVLLLRRTYKQMSDMLERCKILYERQLNWKWEASNLMFRMPSGGYIEIGHCQNPGDEDNYLSKEYNTIIFDQAEQFHEKMIRKITSRCRTTNPDIPPQVLMGFNPGGPGHVWVKTNFVDRCPVVNRGPRQYNEKFKVWWQPKKSSGVYKDQYGMTWEFHPAIVFDNKYIVENDPVYVSRLLALPEDEREAYLWGNFEMFSGQYFSEYRRDIHVLSESRIGKVPNTWEVYGGNDYASSGWWYQGVAALTHNGEVIIVDEDAFMGGSLRFKAERIDNMLKNWPRIKKWAAPWDMFNRPRDRETDATQEAIVDKLKKHMTHKVNFVKAPRSRLDGWELIKDGLTWSDGQKPWLYFSEKCERLIETLPTLIRDENDFRDVAKGGYDHAADFLRYVLGIIKRRKLTVPEDVYHQTVAQTKKLTHWLLK